MFAVQRIEIHPDFNFVDQTGLNNVALLQLANPVVFSDCLNAACLPTTFDSRLVEKLDNCYITGWGQIAATFLPRPNVLREGRVGFDDQLNNVRLFTARGRTAGGDVIDSCIGDNGGPLVCERDGAFVVEGITFETGCGFLSRPSVYIRVDGVLAFIREFVSDLR